MPLPAASPPRQRVPFAVLMGLLAWLPVPLGSNRPWAWALLEVAALGLLAAWLVGWARRPFPLPAAARATRGVLVLLGAWAGWVLLQALPLPPAVLAALSPSSSALYAAAADAGAPVTPAISVDRAATLAEFLKICAYVALFFMTLVLVSSARRLRVALTVLACVGAGEALYGLVIHLGEPRGGAAAALNAVRGSYVNRNHFAGLMELTLPAALGLLIAQGAGRGGGTRYGWRPRLRAAADFLLGATGRTTFLVLLMCAGLVLSTSRGGLVSLAVAVGAVTGLAVLARGPRTTEARLAPATLLVAVLAVAWLGLGGLDQKLRAAGLENDRGVIHAPVYAMLAERPLTGAGAGSFRWEYPRFRSAALGGGFVEHAHSDYLEVLADQGVIGFTLLGTAVGALLLRLARGFRRRRDRLMRGVLFAALTGGAALLVHGTVDFNFQIPANAALWWVLLALGVVATLAERERGEGAHGGRRIPAAPLRRVV